VLVALKLKDNILLRGRDLLQMLSDVLQAEIFARDGTNLPALPDLREVPRQLALE